MSNQTEQESSEISVGFGIPQCECGACWKELEVSPGVINVGVDAVAKWMESSCPGPKKVG